MDRIAVLYVERQNSVSIADAGRWVDCTTRFLTCRLAIGCAKLASGMVTVSVEVSSVNDQMDRQSKDIRVEAGVRSEV